MVGLRCCLIGVALIIKKLVVLQGHCKVQCFVSTAYCVLDRRKISSDSNVLFKAGSFEVLFYSLDVALIIKKLIVFQGHV